MAKGDTQLYDERTRKMSGLDKTMTRESRSRGNRKGNMPAGNITGPGQVRAKGIFSGYRNKKTPAWVGSWSDVDYLTVRPLDINVAVTGWGASHGDESCRGYSDTPGSMTKLDALLLQAVDGISKFDVIKDWENAQRSAFINKLFLDFQILYNLGLQRLLHNLLLQPSEDDSFTADEIVWDLDSYRAYVHSLAYKKYPMFSWSINLAKTVVGAVNIALGYPEKSKKERYYMPYHPNYTITKMEECRTKGYQIMESLEHAKKIGLSWEVFSEDMVNSVPRIHAMGSAYDQFHKIHSAHYYYDGAAAVVALPVADFYGGNHATAVIPIPSDGKIHDIHALAALLNTVYHANNPNCAVQYFLSHTTEDAWSLREIAFNGTVPSTYKADSSACRTCLQILKFVMGGSSSVTWAGAGDASQVLIDSDFVYEEYERDHLFVTGISSTEWNDYLITAFRELFSRPLC